MTDLSKLGIPQLIDCEEEVFNEFCADKDMGYISGLHNLMMLTFNEVKDIKDQLVAKMTKEDGGSEEEKRVLNGLYSKLLKVEHRVFVLREIMESRKIQ